VIILDQTGTILIGDLLTNVAEIPGIDTVFGNKYVAMRALNISMGVNKFVR